MVPLRIRVPEDQGVRFENDEWDGPAIGSLGEVLGFLDGHRETT